MLLALGLMWLLTDVLHMQVPPVSRSVAGQGRSCTILVLRTMVPVGMGLLNAIECY